jgi:hypothetical protein
VHIDGKNTRKRCCIAVIVNQKEYGISLGHKSSSVCINVIAKFAVIDFADSENNGMSSGFVILWG